MGYYKELEVWKMSVKIAKDVYKMVENFPKTELYSLVDQMKRASVSVVSNIAEWSGRSSIPDNIRFLYMSQGSCVELEAQILLSQELWFVDWEEIEQLLSDITILQKMLYNFIQSKKKMVE